MKPKLGQHFLFDQVILDKIIDAANINDDDTIIEIGPGPGTLTVKLLEKANRVVAIELDRLLHHKLVQRFQNNDKLQLILGDALKFDFGSIGKFKVVSNIPYQITTPLIFKLLKNRDNLTSMTLTMQKEVADRIIAVPGSKAYGILSLTVQYHTQPLEIFSIPPEAFRPPPKVKSTVINFRILQTPSVEVSDPELYFRIIKAAFNQRRKTIANTLKSLYGEDTKGFLLLSDINPTHRPETLSSAQFANLANVIKGSKG
ncbi:MAG: ribosomal RNA small subunit methyltransferase A [Nitrospirae bacterium]|nr:ribosomal RNA small subunit methyltransferase A [Nitrospirota bacterium]MBF0541787.1 ribosomal RNA small subunit methyltransferase A [Nitrospirota bacterium]